MFGFVFKSSLYYVLWNKFKSQFITILVSIILIAVIFSVYEDLYKVLKISSKESVIVLFLTKWFLVFLILAFNWYQFRKLTKLKHQNDDCDYNFVSKISNKKHSYSEPLEASIKETSSRQHQSVMNKKQLKTKTDVILQKYLDK